MKLRIVLSLLLLLGLCVSACDAELSRGIGTSPSLADDDPVAAQTSAVDTPAPCGVWVQHSDELSAEDASTRRPPDLVQYTLPGGLSCAWTFQLTALVWPGRSFIRGWR